MRQSLLLLPLLILLTACADLENTPERPSPYGGDATLFRADQNIVTGRNLLNEFTTWEKNYRTFINNLDVKHAADNVRLHGKQWVASAIRLCEAYKLNPTSANKDALEASLDVIAQALAESMNYMLQYSKKK